MMSPTVTIDFSGKLPVVNDQQRLSIIRIQL